MAEHTTITFFLCDQMLATSVALPLEQFRAAETMARAQSGKAAPRLGFKLASINGAPVRTHTGITMAADCSLGEVAQTDIVYLPALWRNPKPILRHNAALQPWLVGHHRDNAIIAGVGTGCCFMAEAGLLNFRPATTHWYYFDEFARQYPLVELKRQYFITQSHNLYCTGSVTSLADLTIYFIQEIFDRAIARLVERHFFHEVRQPYALPNTALGNVSAHPDEDIAEAQSWMRHNAHQEIQIRNLAAEVKMSLRTFNRRFKAATGVSPVQYLQRVRMENAGQLLKSSNFSVAEIAYRCGYQDPAHFTELFRKYFGTTPSQYRTTVRAKLFHAD